jgi:eukaryotic-like serine/threonine-protein kinase
VTQGMALSPDGSMLVYAGDKLVIRSMSELEGHPIPGTGNSSGPFFSPDGKWIGFIAFGKLKKVSVSGGSPIVLVDSLPNVTGAAWGVNDSILFTGAARGIVSVPSSGGRPRTITKVAAGEIAHTFPEFLPDGNGILFTIWHGANQNAELAAATLDGTVTRLHVNGLGVHYFAGNIVFAHADGSLAVAPFDPKRHVVGAERPVGLVIQVASIGGTGYAVSPTGTLVYAPNAALPTQAVLVDRVGVQRLLHMDARPYQRPRFSPDGRRIAFDTRVNVDGEIWVYDLASETPQRLVAGEDVHSPEWQPHGNLLAYTARKDSTNEDLMIVPVDGSAEPRPVFSARGDQYDATWTPDGQALMYLDDDPIQGIWMVRLDDRKPVKWLSGSGASTLGPRVSPDGRWIAYASNQSGRDEVYVRSFPTPAGVVQISSGGGNEPVWSHDGRVLYYRQDDKLIEATLVTTKELSVASRRPLFVQRFVTDGGHTYYDVSPDGKSFVFVKDNDALAQLVVVLNWDAELRKQAAKP